MGYVCRSPGSPIRDPKGGRIGLWESRCLGYAGLIEGRAALQRPCPRGPTTGPRSMNRSTVASRPNLELIEDQYQRWRQDPSSVDPTWRIFFEGYDLGSQADGRAAPPSAVDGAIDLRTAQ